jgi:hypothetical protein
MNNKQMVVQYFDFIKAAGFDYSKDNLGFYFDNGLKKFSVIKTGPFMQCYYNKMEKDKWVLKDKSQSTSDILVCLMWILKNIQEKE